MIYFLSCLQPSFPIILSCSSPCWPMIWKFIFQNNYMFCLGSSIYVGNALKNNNVHITCNNRSLDMAEWSSADYGSWDEIRIWFRMVIFNAEISMFLRSGIMAIRTTSVTYVCRYVHKAFQISNFCRWRDYYYLDFSAKNCYFNLLRMYLL
jgi:hypothetical protein